MPPHGVVISPTGGVLEGRADIERIYRVWFTAFADYAFGIEDLIIEGDRVALLGRVTGRHSGEFFGVPATGRRIDIACGFFYRFEDGSSRTSAASSTSPACWCRSACSAPSRPPECRSSTTVRGAHPAAPTASAAAPR